MKKESAKKEKKKYEKKLTFDVSDPVVICIYMNVDEVYIIFYVARKRKKKWGKKYKKRLLLLLLLFSYITYEVLSKGMKDL